MKKGGAIAWHPSPALNNIKRMAIFNSKKVLRVSRDTYSVSAATQSDKDVKEEEEANSERREREI